MDYVKGRQPETSYYPVDAPTDKHSSDLNKKITLLQYFRNYLSSNNSPFANKVDNDLHQSYVLVPHLHLSVWHIIIIIMIIIIHIC